MLAIKRSVAIIAILFSPLSTASNLTSQLHNFFSAQLAGVSDEVRVSIRTAPNLLPPCEQPLLSMSNNSRLWGNVNVLAAAVTTNDIYRLMCRPQEIMWLPQCPLCGEESWKLAMSN